MFSISTNDTDEPTSYQTFSPSSEYNGDSRSGSQSPSGLSEGSTAGPSASNPPTGSTKNTRKRRAQLLPINLANSSSNDVDELATPTTSSSHANSDEESFAAFPRPIASSNDLHDKRIRLTSSSSTSSSASLFSLVSEGSQALNPADSYHDLADSEFGQNTPSTKASHGNRNGTIIANGEFELVGSGQECKAIHIPTQTIHHCMAMNQDDYNNFMAIIGRIESAKNRLTADEMRELRRLLVPEETRIVRMEASKPFYYAISPDHQGSLHTFYTAANPSITARTHSPWTEQESKVIFKQIVQLASYCHQIGIYFGDFRLQKLVYTNRKNNQIRVLNLRNIYVAPLINDDLIQKPSSKCCPAYIAPEMMRFDQPYSAKFADIWSLGISLFLLLTGRFPFCAPKPSQLARMIRTGQWSFKPSDKLSRSARLLVYGLIRQNPMERPSAKEILTCDWFQSQVCEPVSGACSALPRPNVTVQIVVPSNGRLSEFNPRIPQQLLGVLMQPSSERTSIYLSRSNVRASMESFANALNRSMTAGLEASVQTVPERPQTTASAYERDSLNISVIRMPSAARTANSS